MVGLAIGATPLNAQLRDTKALTLQAAKHIADAAEAKARANEGGSPLPLVIRPWAALG